MATPTGEVVFDFTVLPNTEPYVPANFARATADTVILEVLSSSVKLFNPTDGLMTRYMYQGAMDPTKDVVASMEIGVAHISDNLYCFIGDKTTGQGYDCRLSNTFLSINTVLAANTEGGLTSTTLGAVTPADVFQFVWNHTSHALSVLQNGTSVLSVTDATYTSNLTFGFGLDGGNNNTSTLLGFAGSGISSAGSKLLSMLNNQAGF